MRSAAVLLTLFASAASATEVSLDLLHFDGFDDPPPTVFRLGALQLRDPHVFVPIPLGPTTLCADATDLADVGLNPQIAASLAADADGDGRYDTSPLLLFKPLRGDSHPAKLTSASGDCGTATPLQCSDQTTAASTRSYRAFSLSGSDRCLEGRPGTTSNWGAGAAPLPQPGGNCYATSAADLVLSTGSISIPLFDSAFAAPLPAATGSTGGGLMRGFLRASDAATIVVPVNGNPMTLASVLPGGAGSCKGNVTGGVDSWNGESGWWFYFEFRQDAVVP